MEAHNLKRYQIERSEDCFVVPGAYYDELLEFACDLLRQMSTDKGALIPDGFGLKGFGYVKTFVDRLRRNENLIRVYGYRLRDFYGNNFLRYSLYYNVTPPDFLPEYRHLGRNPRTGQQEFDVKFKACVEVLKPANPAESSDVFEVPPPFVEPETDAQILEIRAIKKWLFKQKEAKSRGISFELTVEDMKGLLVQEHCYYSGIKLKHYDDGSTEPPADQFTLDRIDNSVGYVKGNVVPCSYQVNNVKSDGNAESIDRRLANLREELERTLKNLEMLTAKRDNLETQVQVLEMVQAKLTQA